MMAKSYLVMALIFVFIVSTLYQSSSSPTTKHLKDTAVSSSSSYRNLLANQRNSIQIPRCNEMVSRSQCSQNLMCKWCRSEALEDMCFSKTEAWRLPHQVFICDS